MIKKSDVLIIGGGAAGSFLYKLHPTAILLEKEERCGKKLLLTGGGLCNFTHNLTAKEIINHYYEKKSFVSSALGSFPPEKLIVYFQNNQIEAEIRKDGCVFVKQGKAEKLCSFLTSDDNNIVLSVTIKSIEKIDEDFIVKTAEDIYYAKNLVIATGGLSYPGTGCTGDGYKIAKQFGHSIIPQNAGLSEIKLNINTKPLSGISIDNVSLYANGQESRGSLLFTHRGISGPAPMCLSRYITKDTTLTIKFCSITDKEMLSRLDKREVKTVIKELTQLPTALIDTIIPYKDKVSSTLTKEERKAIIDTLTHYTVNASTKGMLNIATVTHGGIDTEEIDKKTFMSKLCKNLFFIGEVLDVDGECGGYNLSFAFASAYMVEKYLATKENLA